MKTIYYKDMILDLLTSGLISVETAIILRLEIKHNLLIYAKN